MGMALPGSIFVGGPRAERRRITGVNPTHPHAESVSHLMYTRTVRLLTLAGPRLGSQSSIIAAAPSRCLGRKVPKPWYHTDDDVSCFVGFNEF